jgi:hypothetical protein
MIGLESGHLFFVGRANPLARPVSDNPQQTVESIRRVAFIERRKSRTGFLNQPARKADLLDIADSEGDSV